MSVFLYVIYKSQYEQYMYILIIFYFFFFFTYSISVKNDTFNKLKIFFLIYLFFNLIALQKMN